jgi:hypothetical protein
LVGSSEAKKVPGLVRFFCEIFYRVFELPSPRNAKKREKKKIEKKSVLDFFCREKIGFGFFVVFCGVFELPSLSNT